MKSVFGTRPEAIKMCPLVKELEKYEEIESVVCLTGQHREMLQQVIDIFGINVKYNLDIMQPRQTLTTITISVLDKIEPVLKEEKPDTWRYFYFFCSSAGILLSADSGRTCRGRSANL